MRRTNLGPGCIWDKGGSATCADGRRQKSEDFLPDKLPAIPFILDQ